jgi:hypothetical protein
MVSQRKFTPATAYKDYFSSAVKYGDALMFYGSWILALLEHSDIAIIE